jgi:hypothetical protein
VRRLAATVVVALMGGALLAGCGGTETSVVTVTKTISAAPPPGACSSISQSSTLLCERRGRRAHETAFYVRRRGGNLVPLPIHKPPGAKAGHWATAFLSPNRKTLLAQWSAECEVPLAFFVSARGGVPRVVSGERDWVEAPESVAHGWTGDGRAIVEFLRGACGGTAGRPGLYLVSLDGTQQFLARVRPRHGT